MDKDYEKTISEITEYIEQNLSEKRRTHTYAVRDTAVKLAKKYGADPLKAEVASLFHDMYRGKEPNQINSYVNLLGLDEKYLDNPNLAHSKIAEKVMQRDFDIDDEDILNAVSYHTTGRKGMSLLEKIVFLSDAIEPNRDYPLVSQIREMADIDLDKACLMSMEGTIQFLKMQNKEIDEDTLNAAAFLKGEIK